MNKAFKTKLEDWEQEIIRKKYYFVPSEEIAEEINNHYLNKYKRTRSNIYSAAKLMGLTEDNKYSVSTIDVIYKDEVVRTVDFRGNFDRDRLAECLYNWALDILPAVKRGEEVIFKIQTTK